MNYWLVKSEPETYSFDDLKRDKRTVWDGVRNFAARNNLRDMKKGDLALFYHSGKGKEIVGIAKVTKEAFPDPTADAAERETWSSVELSYVKALKTPVTLADAKKDKQLASMQLVTHSRLSVQKVKPAEYAKILKKSE